MTSAYLDLPIRTEAQARAEMGERVPGVLFRFYIGVDDGGDFETVSEWAPTPTVALRQRRNRAHAAREHVRDVDYVPDAMKLPDGQIVAIERAVGRRIALAFA